MQKQTKTTTILMLCLLLVACEKPAQETKQTTNSNFNVEKLFTYEGCSVYRFKDDRTVYYTNCSSTAWEHSCGKGCTAHDEVRTSHDN